MRSFRLQDILRPVLITLFIGWLAALAFGLWIAALQYKEVSANLPLSQVSAAYDARIDRVLRHGLVLFLPQIGVMAAILAWQVARRAKHTDNPRLYGAVIGGLVVIVESIVALVMEVPWIYVVLLWALFIGVGVFAAWYAESEQQRSALTGR